MIVFLSIRAASRCIVHPWWQETILKLVRLVTPRHDQQCLHQDLQIQ
jgi:hypothetical protein